MFTFFWFSTSASLLRTLRSWELLAGIYRQQAFISLSVAADLILCSYFDPVPYVLFLDTTYFLSVLIIAFCQPSYLISCYIPAVYSEEVSRGMLKALVTGLRPKQMANDMKNLVSP